VTTKVIFLTLLKQVMRFRAFLKVRHLKTYLAEKLLRYAVERKLTVLSEALAQAKQHFPRVQEDMSELRQIIAFRNRLVHAYLHIDDKAVWGILLDDLGPLVREAEAAMARQTEK